MSDELDDQDPIPEGGKKFVSLLQCPDRLWGPAGTGRFFCRSKAAGAQIKNFGAIPPLSSTSSWLGA
jgi:hypothetical protein